MRSWAISLCAFRICAIKICVICLVLTGCQSQESSSPPNRPAAPAPGVASSPSAKVRRHTEPPPSAADLALRPDDWFEDFTDRSGIQFVHRNGREGQRHYMIESFGGGVGVIDFDRDGAPDLFITGGGTISHTDPVQVTGLPSALYRHQPGQTFADVTHSAGVGLPPDYSQGCTVTDYDVDGFDDLLICCYGHNVLYHNEGDGCFSIRTTAFPDAPREWSTTATCADINHDGLPDVWVARYADWSPERDIPCAVRGERDLCGPTSYSGTSCRVWKNNGDGTFQEFSQEVGIQGNMRGLGIVAADLNLDGEVDIYIAGDVTPNQLYLGGPQLPLMESGAAHGVAVNEWGQPEGSMGVDVGDFDGDLRPDLWVTNFELEDNALYRNLGESSFLHATVAAGLGGVSRQRVGFGTAFQDLDGDGWQDLFVLNGNPIYEVAETPYRQRPQLFQNREGRFTDVTAQGGPCFRTPIAGRGSAVVDLNQDGALDLVIVPINEPVRIALNRKTPASFVSIELRDPLGDLHATGGWITGIFQGRDCARYATRGAGFFSQSDARLILPVDDRLPHTAVTVHWPGGQREVFPQLAVRTTHTLIRGQGQVLHD